MHNDFHLENLLVRGDDVVAVIDWEGARAGDARWDLMMLGSTLDPASRHVDQTTAQLVEAEIQATTPQPARAALAATRALRNLAFAIDHYQQNGIEHAIRRAEQWLRPQWQATL